MFQMFSKCEVWFWNVGTLMYLVAAPFAHLRAVWHCVEGQLAERGGEWLLQLQLGLVHILWTKPWAESADLEVNNHSSRKQEDRSRPSLVQGHTRTCSSRPCLIQPSSTSSSRPRNERSSVTSKLVQRGIHFMWTKFKRVKSHDDVEIVVFATEVTEEHIRHLKLCCGLPLSVWFPISSVAGAE